MLVRALPVLVAIVLATGSCRSDRQTQSGSSRSYESFPFYLPSDREAIHRFDVFEEEGEAQLGFALNGDVSVFLSDYHAYMSRQGFVPLSHSLTYPPNQRGWSKVSESVQVWSGWWLNERGDGIGLILGCDEGYPHSVGQIHRSAEFMDPWLRNYERFHPLPYFNSADSRPH